MASSNFYYLFKATYSPGRGVGKSHAFSKSFGGETPILAREAVFDYYDSYIHGMLLAQGLTDREAGQINDRGVRKILDRYIDPRTWSNLQLGYENSGIVIPDYIGNEFSVCLVIDEDDEILIHSIAKDELDMPRPINISYLEDEYQYYSKNNFDMKDYARVVHYFDVDEYDAGHEDTALGIHTILETPFDWTGYDKEGWWRSN